MKKLSLIPSCNSITSKENKELYLKGTWSFCSFGHIYPSVALLLLGLKFVYKERRIDASDMLTVSQKLILSVLDKNCLKNTNTVKWLKLKDSFLLAAHHNSAIIRITTSHFVELLFTLLKFFSRHGLPLTGRVTLCKNLTEYSWRVASGLDGRGWCLLLLLPPDDFTAVVALHPRPHTHPWGCLPQQQVKRRQTEGKENIDNGHPARRPHVMNWTPATKA